MIDLHCHILPGIDDGTSTDEEALTLAAAASRDGVTTIAATPHLRRDYPLVRPAELAHRVELLQRELNARGVPVRLVCAGEVDTLWASKASESELTLVSYAQRGTDLLLETPYGFLPPIFEPLIADLRDLGYRILLAHPERNPTFQGDPAHLKRLAREGVLLQVGADSLALAPRRSPSRRLALMLIEEGLAHVIASDAHGPKLGRGPELWPAVAATGRSARARAAWMVRDAPAAILAGDPLPPAPHRTRGLLVPLSTRES